MTFPAYPEYKPSGFDWLPEVPAHWVDRKIARDIPFVVGWTPPSGKDEYYDGDLPWVTIADMTQISVEDTKSKISHLAVRDKGAKVFPAGSMLFSFKLSVGKIAFLTIDSYTNEAIAGFLPCGPLDLEYWKYAAPEFIPRYGRENIYGATLLNQELISSVRFFAPARVEQTQIARFLDHETARIDALIEEQQRLIELLKEKRQAVISHAVTKGLDPEVPMKDSGVEWLGEVPAHWETTPLRYVATMIDGDRSSSYPSEDDLVDEGVPFVSSKNIVGYKFTDVNLNFITPEKFSSLGRGKLRDGDLVITVRGTIGHVAVFDSAVIGSNTGFINAQMMIIRPKAGLTEYLRLCSESSFWQKQLEVAAYGSTVKQLSNPIVGGLIIALPPRAEIPSLVSRVEALEAEFEELISEAQMGTSLLQERRSALISAAVTGKIDVRDWQPPASTQAPESAVAEAV